MSDIFLSYASEDRERVRLLAEALMQEGWSVFWDRVIPVGKTWHEMLEEELSAARSLLIVWSENSIKSKWVREEADEGLRMKLPLFPVLLDAVLPPLGFRGIQAADFSRWDEGTESPVFQNLVRDIRSTLGPLAAPETEHPEPEATEIETSEPEFLETPPPEPTPPEVKKGWLWVNTEPRDAKVRFLNFEADFTQGLELEPGRYELEVSADGYEKKREDAELDAGEDKRLNITLTQLKARLWVKTEPPEAAVRIINFEAEFSQGMELEPGRYEFEVSADGYGTQNEWVELNPGEEKRLSIALTKIKAHLWVETNPPDTKVRFLNLKTEFFQGMELEPGRYEIEASKEGYVAKSEGLELGAGEDRRLSFKLSPIIPPDLAEPVKSETIAAKPAEPEPPGLEAAEPEPLEPRPSEPPKTKTPEQVIKSRAFLIGGLAGLALLLLMVGLWWFLPGQEAQPVPKELKPITNSIGMKFVLIPAGTFQMGSPSDEPDRYKDERQHQVTISRPFYLQTTEVTQGQWQKVMGGSPSYFKKCGKDCPVEEVSWHDAQEFIKKLNELEKTDKYRLPTEAEWEYACRADSKDRWSFGDDEAKLGEYAWYLENSGDKTHPVGQKKPNAWGLYDMHGNVWEWCQDWFGEYPTTTWLWPVTDPTGPTSTISRVLRGGSWSSSAELTRSANRYWDGPDGRGHVVGFRVARAL